MKIDLTKITTEELVEELSRRDNAIIIGSIYLKQDVINVLKEHNIETMNENIDNFLIENTNHNNDFIADTIGQEFENIVSEHFDKKLSDVFSE